MATFRNEGIGTLTAIDLKGNSAVPGLAGEIFQSQWPSGWGRDPNRYFEFGVDAIEGYMFEPTSIKYSLVQYFYSNFIGPSYYFVHASTDHFQSSDVSIGGNVLYGNPLDTEIQFTLSDFSALGSTSFDSLTIRLYGTNATHAVSMGGFANSSRFGGDGTNLIIEGNVYSTVVPEPISSILFITGGTLFAGRHFIKRRKKA